MMSEAEKPAESSENLPDAPHIPDVEQEMVPQKMPPEPALTEEEQGHIDAPQQQQENITEEHSAHHAGADAWDDDNMHEGQGIQGESEKVPEAMPETVQEKVPEKQAYNNLDYDDVSPPIKKRFPIEKFGVAHPQFKKIDPEVLEFYREYIDKAVAPQIKLNHAQFACFFHYGTIFKQFYPMPNCFNICIMVNQQEYINVSLPKDLVNFILHPLIEPLSILELGDDIIMNLLEISLAPYLENFEKTLGYHISFKLSEQPVQECEFFTQWVVQEINSGQTCAVNLYGKKDNIKDFFDKIYVGAQLNPKIKPTISLSVVSAIKQFPVQKVKALKHGEIIIILTNRHLVNEPLAIIGQRLVVTTQISGDKLNIQSVPTPITEIAELNMNQGDALPEQQSIADNVTASMTDMRVPVTFELARMDLPVTSLSNLGQGQIIDLNKQIDENVSILVNGKVVAVGEVVQVGRNFGVIIKEVV